MRCPTNMVVSRFTCLDRWRGSPVPPRDASCKPEPNRGRFCAGFRASFRFVLVELMWSVALLRYETLGAKQVGGDNTVVPYVSYQFPGFPVHDTHFARGIDPAFDDCCEFPLARTTALEQRLSKTRLEVRLDGYKRVFACASTQTIDPPLRGCAANQTDVLQFTM